MNSMLLHQFTFKRYLERAWPLSDAIEYIKVTDSSDFEKIQLQMRSHFLDSHTQVDVALAAGRPLLVAGPPGCGKSRLADAMAAAKGWNFLSHAMASKTRLEELTGEPDLYLTYVKEDTSLAHAIAEWLKRQKLDAKLVEVMPNQPNTAVQEDHSILLRLWTRAAQQSWQSVSTDIEQNFANNLLLRTEPAATPAGINPAQIIELADWQSHENTDQARQLLATLNDWMAGKKTPAQPSSPPSAEKADTGATYSAEVTQLIDELVNPDTPPRRRLEIGDRLNEIGDPRPGVGVREYEIIEYSPEAQSLLNELQDINTIPPRRFEIGNLLDKMDDPRIGVGLDDNGLPEIDWVEIPTGDFIYGEGKAQKTLSLDTFYMSRYTITNKQFQTFINDGGYEDEHCWQDLRKPEPEESRWQQENKDGDWYLQETTAVGVYPHGKSPYGIKDMSGIKRIGHSLLSGRNARLISIA